MSNFNPFKENRTEQMRDLWRYYVPVSGLDGAKPVIVEGGRGSGKTMFFQCNSWRQIIDQLRKESKSITSLYVEKEYIGIYYRVDTTFVSSMREREIEPHRWEKIFETYLAICILQEILDLLINLDQEIAFDGMKKKDFVKRFSTKIYKNTTSETLDKFREETDLYLDLIEDVLNGVQNVKDIGIRLISSQRYINDLCNACLELLKAPTLIFKIFIDEYETLQQYQQKIVNTLIKHSTVPIIFNIGLRPCGMRTNATTSDTEIIEEPHDYANIKLGITDSTDYEDLIRNICNKRLELAIQQGKIPENGLKTIDDYLKSYNFDYELSKLKRVDKLEYPHKAKLRDIICKQAKDESIDSAKLGDIITTLCDDADILESRLHYALLLTKSQYKPTLDELYKAYTEKTKTYIEWLHTRKSGLIFLLCQELRKRKLYYGFDTYVALSSQNVRYFLELCEQAFNIAFLSSDYTWEKVISPEIQTEAAKTVSEYKLTDITAYEPYGKELRIFIQYLGQLFHKLHCDEFSSVGEPEPNHFCTRDLSLTPDIQELLDSAIMWNTLQIKESTKRKQSKSSGAGETIDYYLNKIYTPYFGISYRNQRKIVIDIAVLEDLLSGDENKASKAVQRYYKKKNEINHDNETYFDFGEI